MLLTKFNALNTSAKHEVLEWLYQGEIVQNALRYRRGQGVETLTDKEMSRLFDMSFNVRVWKNAAGCIACSREYYPFEGAVAFVTKCCEDYLKRFESPGRA